VVGVRADAVWRVPAVVGSACTGLYAAQLSAAVNGACFLVVGFGGAATFFLGPRLHPTGRAPWYLFGTGCLLFLASSVLHPSGQDGFGRLVGDAVSIPGYLLLVAGLGLLLRARRSLDRHAITDVLIVCLGGGLVSLVALTLPGADRQDRPVLVAVVAGVYPILDVVLLLVVVNLAFTTAVHSRSFVFLCSAVTLLVAGDLGFAWTGAYGEGDRSPYLALPYLASFTLLGCAALHPSMVELARALPRPVQAWSGRRLALLVPALAVPFGLLAVVTDRAERLSAAGVGAVMVLALLVRASAAVAGYARAQEVFRHQATHDGLTGLLNRAALVATAERLLTGDRPVWLLFLDLDGFKMVNDSWGHEPATG
jgi:hypothetical protein